MTSTPADRSPSATPVRSTVAPVGVALDRRRVAWIAIAAGLAALLLLIGYLRGPGLDTSVYMAVARSIAEGGMPYRDAFDHKPPGMYLALASVSWLPIDAWGRAWLVSSLSALGVLVASGFLLQRRLSVGTIAFAVAMLGGALVLASGTTIGSGGTTESLGVVFATAALAATVRDGARPMWFLVAGLLVGVAVVISLQLASAGVAILVLALARPDRVRAVAATIVGGATVGLLTLGWLVAGGALDAAWDALVTYNRAYLAGAQLLRPDVAARALGVLVIGLPLILGSAIRIATILRRRPPGTLLEWALAAWLVVWAALVLIQGNFYAHYVVAVAPALILLGARGLDRLLPSSTGSPAPIAMAVALLLLPLGLLVATRPDVAPAPELTATVGWLRDHGADDDRLFVWGNEPALYNETDLTPASRFVALLPLTTPGYADEDLIDGLAADWTADPPDLIVDAAYHPMGHSSLPLLQPWPFEGEPIPDGLGPLRDVVRDRYHEVERIGDWVIYAATP